MPRRPRAASGGYVYHVLNRAVRRMTLFETDADYAAFERVLAEAVQRRPDIRLLSYIVMPNHWHLVVWPKGDDDLSEFMRWLTVTHAQRWHANRKSAGTGPVYQGRYKSFPVERDQHFFSLCRYCERNALRANLVRLGQLWRPCSLWHRVNAGPMLNMLSPWPLGCPSDWLSIVNRAQSPAELAVLQQCVRRGTPFGSPTWSTRAARRLGLPTEPRNPGRPRKSA